MRFRQRLCEYALRNSIYGLAEVYMRCCAKGYTRYKGYKKPEVHSERVLKIVKEKSTYETGKYLLELEKNMGFKIKTIQVDNGYEFVNDAEKTNKKTSFQLATEQLRMQTRKIRPYSPWQNGKVERSHREDGRILYNRKVFTSEKELIKSVEKHVKRYNSTAKTSLNFKSPNEVVSKYFSKCNICLDN